MAETSETIQVTLRHSISNVAIEVPQGADLGFIRTLDQELQNVGAPRSDFNLAVNNAQQDDSYILQEGDTISFRPVSASKG